MNRISCFAQAFLKGGLDIILPPLCLSCRQPLEGSGGLCASCWKEISFINMPLCNKCGLPFEFEVGSGIECGMCVAKPPFYEQCRSVFVYNEFSRDIILRFKHNDMIAMVPVFKDWMLRAGEIFLQDIDLVIPVPLHWTRLFLRTYNQSALLARSIAQCIDKPYLPNVLKKFQWTPSQGVLSKKERERNVSTCFKVSREQKHWIQNKNILLVDDVFTTGATVNTCAKILKKFGTKKVNILTLSRAVGPN